MVYRFIQKHSGEFGTRWLLRRLNIYPNAYYNFLKDRKANWRPQKARSLATITSIYHEHSGVDGYRSMRVFLARKNIQLSRQTVHKYMNKELKLYSIVRKKRYRYEKGMSHKVFENLINQEFRAKKPNQK